MGVPDIIAVNLSDGKSTALRVTNHLGQLFFITEKMREAYGHYKRLQLSLMEFYNFSGIVKQSERLGVIPQVCLIHLSINKPISLP